MPKSEANFLGCLFLHCNNDTSFLLHLERLCWCNICKENAFVVLTPRERSNAAMLDTGSVTHCCWIRFLKQHLLQASQYGQKVWTENPGCSQKMFSMEMSSRLYPFLYQALGVVWRSGEHNLVKESWDTGFQLFSESYQKSKYSFHLLYQQIGFPGFQLVWYCSPISKVK